MISERNGILRGTTIESIFSIWILTLRKGREGPITGRRKYHGGKFNKGVLTQFALKY